MNLSSLIDSDLVFVDLASGAAETVLRSLAERVAKAGAVPSAKELYEKLLERERLGSTAIGRGVAIPHCKMAALPGVVLAVGRSARGVKLDTPDREPVRLLFLLVSPEKEPAAHLQSLAAVSKWVKSPDNLERLRRVRSKEDLLACLRGGSDNNGQ